MTQGTYELRSNGEDSRIFGPAYEKDNELLIASGRAPRRAAYWRLVATCEADSWLAAKVHFGEALTPLQDRMVKGTASPFEVVGHTRYPEPLKELTRRARAHPNLAQQIEEAVEEWAKGEAASLDEAAERRLADDDSRELLNESPPEDY